MATDEQKLNRIGVGRTSLGGVTFGFRIPQGGRSSGVTAEGRGEAGVGFGPVPIVLGVIFSGSTPLFNEAQGIVPVVKGGRAKRARFTLGSTRLA